MKVKTFSRFSFSPSWSG